MRLVLGGLIVRPVVGYVGLGGKLDFRVVLLRPPPGEVQAENAGIGMIDVISLQPHGLDREGTALDRPGSQLAK